jgi:hypothetical protein
MNLEWVEPTVTLPNGAIVNAFLIVTSRLGL